MVGFLLYDPCFFRYGSKLLGLGINGLMMSLFDMCQLLELLLELRQFLLELLLVFLPKFPLLENYKFSSLFYYNIFLVCNKLVG